jgi:fluoride exporter
LGEKVGLIQAWFWLVVRHKMVWLCVGGAAGTLLRYWVAQRFNSQWWGQAFPYGTLFINVTGSFILAFAAVIILERLPPEYSQLYMLIGTGFCGGYTTFSTFEWETFQLVRNGSWPLALTNVLVSVVAGFAGVVVAVMLAQLLFPNQKGP